MLIINETGVDMECIIDHKSMDIHKNEIVEIYAIDHIELKHIGTSFVCDGMGKSKLLKVLSFFDDPFKTKKEYHICINSTFDISNCSEDDKLTIKRQSIFADVDLQIFYDCFVLSSDNQLVPNSVTVSDDHNIGQLFEKYNKSNIRWMAIYDIFIEPIIFEIIGYIAVYWIFSLWFGAKALWIIGILLLANILIETIMFCRKCKSYEASRFYSFLRETEIINQCYLQAK